MIETLCARVVLSSCVPPSQHRWALRNAPTCRSVRRRQLHVTRNTPQRTYAKGLRSLGEHASWRSPAVPPEYCVTAL
eukprot:7387526-Prymnesium_polylepis.1